MEAWVLPRKAVEWLPLVGWAMDGRLGAALVAMAVAAGLAFAKKERQVDFLGQ